MKMQKKLHFVIRGQLRLRDLTLIFSDLEKVKWRCVSFSPFSHFKSTLVRVSGTAYHYALEHLEIYTYLLLPTTVHRYARDRFILVQNGSARVVFGCCHGDWRTKLSECRSTPTSDILYPSVVMVIPFIGWKRLYSLVTMEITWVDDPAIRGEVSKKGAWQRSQTSK